MSPIGEILLSNCDKYMRINLEVVKNLLPGINPRRIVAVAIMLGITITDSII